TENFKPQRTANTQNKHRAQHRATAKWKRCGAQKHSDMKALNTQADNIMYVVNNSERITCIECQPGSRDKSATPASSAWTLLSNASRLFRTATLSSITMIRSNKSSTSVR